MKKVILSMAFIMACSLVAAQSESNITLEKPEFKYKYFKPLEFSINTGLGTTGIVYPDSHLATGNKTGWSLGFNTQYNIDFIGLRLGASYELNRSFFIDENDPLNSTHSFRQTAINIPATLLFQSRDRNGFGIYTGVGVNMRYSLSSSLDIPNYSTNNMQWNAHAVVGVRIKRLYIEEEIGSQLNNLLKSGAGAPKSQLSTTMLKIGWVF